VRAAFGCRARLLLLLAAVLSGICAGGRGAAGSPIAAGNDILDRMALAVDGIESSYGSDPLMWRADPDGPQGPMQVSAAAALDVGGGDRFETVENRTLGRAYLSDLYRRYGNWPDAIAAYNWGPGNMDAWIRRKRPPWDMPVTVALYRARVLAAALYGPAGRAEPWLMLAHRQPRRSLADLRHPSQASVAVEHLYGVVMRLGAMQSH
jgi:Transglycosylase SLT domain